MRKPRPGDSPSTLTSLAAGQREPTVGFAGAAEACQVCAGHITGTTFEGLWLWVGPPWAVLEGSGQGPC